jgi:CheY-like chemotaxis protein
VVDDEPTGRLILNRMLGRLGFEVVEAENGEAAVERFQACQPDLVLMDVMMPVMDGYEATRRIRRLERGRFVPIIFLTAITSREDQAKCFDAGGDDVLSKPYDTTLLASKISALERIRTLHGETEMLLNRLHRDQEIARHLYDVVVTAPNVAGDALSVYLEPAGQFSGDVFLSARGPSGDLHVILADFTGHGLAAALGALPAAETFRAMVSKGFSGAQVLDGLNAKLTRLLPPGLFMAAQYLVVHRDLSRASMLNCGMPDALVLDGAGGGVKQRIVSSELPLGIIQDERYQLTPVSVTEGDRIVLLSDGAVEAESTGGEQFGAERIEAALIAAAGGPRVPRLVSELEAFCAGREPDDDVSVVEVAIVAGLVEDPAGAREEALAREDATLSGGLEPEGDTPPGAGGAAADWEFALSLSGQRLRTKEPVPLIINEVQELEGLAEHRTALFTILTELYVNALDHGLLRLDSSLKTLEGGFGRYFEEREHRLARLAEGTVRFRLSCAAAGSGGRLTIRVEDTGSGFDFETYRANRNDRGAALSGRGLQLVESLCESLVFDRPGNQVEAIFVW